MAATTTAMGQVLGGSSTYGSNSGLSFNVGTHYTFGRSFVYMDEQRYVWDAVEPRSYSPRWFNPIYGIGWWSESPSDDFMFGYQVMGTYGVERYQVRLGTETLAGRNSILGVNLGCYVGWHFGSQLTVGAGVQYESRMSVAEGGRVNIFNSRSAIGAMAMVRYGFGEDFFATLQGAYGLFSFGDFGSSDWERYKSIGSEGYYVVENDTRCFTLMLGIGKGF